jgi:hypothetical protein
MSIIVTDDGPAQAAPVQLPAGDTARWFLDAIFGVAADDGRDVVIWTLPDRATRTFKDTEKAARYAMTMAARKDVYFGLGMVEGSELAPGKRGELSDVKGITCLWCDIDIAGDTHDGGKKALPKSDAEAMRLLESVGLAPSIVVHSGGGLHAYWCLQEPWVFDTAEEREKCQNFAKLWGGTVQARGREMGWYIDNLLDLTRVLRVPGTKNRKGGGERDVRVLVPAVGTPPRNLPRYTRDHFEAIFVAGAEESHTALKAAAATIGTLTLDPAATAPEEKLEALRANNEKFSRSWDRRRPDLKDQSASGYEISLLTIAAAAGWSDQELANLSIHWRRVRKETPEKSLRRDYLAKLIAKAKASTERDSGTETDANGGGGGGDEESGDDAVADTSTASREGRLRFLRRKLRIPTLAGVIRHGKSDSSFDLTLEDGSAIVIGDIGNLLNWGHVQKRVADATNHVPSGLSKKWKSKYAEWLLQMAVVRETLSAEDETREWINHLARSKGRVDLKDTDPERDALFDAVRGGDSFFSTDGQAFIRLACLLRHVETNRLGRVKGQQRELADRLSRLQFTPKPKAARSRRNGTVRTGRYWMSPDGFLLPEREEP